MDLNTLSKTKRMLIVTLLLYPQTFNYYMQRDASCFQSYLRMLEILASRGHQCIDLSNVTDQKTTTSTVVNGVTRVILGTSNSLADTLNRIIRLQPDVLWLNDHVSPWIRLIRERVPRCRIIARAHIRIEGDRWFPSSLTSNLDQIVISHSNDLEALKNHHVPQTIIPFLADGSPFQRNTRVRDLDFVASSRQDLATKQKDLIDGLFTVLTARGYRCQNVIDVEHATLVSFFQRGKVFVYPSLIEASGGRVLVEAMQAGMYPIVDAYPNRSRDLIESLGVGTSISTGVLGCEWNQAVGNRVAVDSTQRNFELLADQLVNILQTTTFPRPVDPRLNYNREIDAMVRVTLQSSTQA